MNMNVQKFEDLNLYSNKNVEKLASQIVAESSNAVLCSMFEDGAVLLDHNSGQFYLCEYTFDPKQAQFLFENFEPITLVRDNDTFRDSVYNFFDSDDVSVNELAEDFKDIVLEQDKFLDELVAESMMYKNFDGLIDYGEVAENNKEHGLQNESFFQKYQERLISHPLTEAKYFNWKDPVRVSLVETERTKLLNSSAKERAHGLWKNENFKEGFSSAAEKFIEDVDEGIADFTALFEEFPQVFYLDTADRKTMFGKIIINDVSLREDRAELLKGLDIMFLKEDSINEIAEQYLDEDDETHYAADAFRSGESMDFTGDDGKTAPSREEKDEMLTKKRDEDKAEELQPEELEKLAEVCRKLADKLKGTAKEKLEKVADKLDKGKEEGTDVNTVKEAIEMLSL
jgi:hypothetical protein